MGDLRDKDISFSQKRMWNAYLKVYGKILFVFIFHGELI